MSKQHSERLQSVGNTVAEKDDIWAAVMEVWANLPSADVARGFVQADKILLGIPDVIRAGRKSYDLLQEAQPEHGSVSYPIRQLFN